MPIINMAVVESGVVTNVLSVDETNTKTIEALNLVPIPHNLSVGIGCLFDGTAFDAPILPEEV